MERTQALHHVSQSTSVESIKQYAFGNPGGHSQGLVASRSAHPLPRDGTDLTPRIDPICLRQSSLVQVEHRA